MTFAKVGPKRLNGNADFRATPLQIATLRLINRRNPDGSLMDSIQMRKLLGYKGTKQGFSYVLGHLAAHGFIQPGPFERRTDGPGGPRRTYLITARGQMVIRPSKLPGATP